MSQVQKGTDRSEPGLQAFLQVVASRQRVILFCILIYLVTVIGQFFVPQEVRPILALLMIGVSLVATVFIILLATRLYNVAIGIVCGILTLIPIVGLITLLVINARATNTLRRNGIEVGLMGAKI